MWQNFIVVFDDHRDSRDSHKNPKHLKTSQTKSTPSKKQEKISELFQTNPETELYNISITSVEESSKLHESSVGPLNDKTNVPNTSVAVGDKDETRMKPPVEQKTKTKPEKSKSRPVSRAQSRAASKMEWVCTYNICYIYNYLVFKIKQFLEKLIKLLIYYYIFSLFHCQSLLLVHKQGNTI